MELIDVLLALLLIAAIALSVYLIFFLRRLNQTVESVQRDIHELVDKTIPVIENLNEATEKINSVTEQAEKQITDISFSLDSLKGKFGFLFPGERKKSKKFEGPLSEIVSYISAFIKGFSSSWSKSK